MSTWNLFVAGIVSFLTILGGLTLIEFLPTPYAALGYGLYAIGYGLAGMSLTYGTPSYGLAIK